MWHPRLFSFLSSYKTLSGGGAVNLFFTQHLFYDNIDTDRGRILTPCLQSGGGTSNEICFLSHQTLLQTAKSNHQFVDWFPISQQPLASVYFHENHQVCKITCSRTKYANAKTQTEKLKMSSSGSCETYHQLRYDNVCLIMCIDTLNIFSYWHQQSNIYVFVKPADLEKTPLHHWPSHFAAACKSHRYIYGGPQSSKHKKNNFKRVSIIE